MEPLSGESKSGLLLLPGEEDREISTGDHSQAHQEEEATEQRGGTLRAWEEGSVSGCWDGPGDVGCWVLGGGEEFLLLYLSIYTYGKGQRLFRASILNAGKFRKRRFFFSKRKKSPSFSLSPPSYSNSSYQFSFRLAD